jgi:hypothetical protein
MSTTALLQKLQSRSNIRSRGAPQAHARHGTALWYSKPAPEDRTTQFAAFRPWAGVFICLYLAAQALIAFGAVLLFLGTKKVGARFFLGIIVVAVPGFIFIGFLAALLWHKERHPYYARQAWALVHYTIMGILLWSLTAFCAVVHITRHGNFALMQPVTDPMDGGTSFLMTCAVALMGALLMMWETLQLIYVYVLPDSGPVRLGIHGSKYVILKSKASQ